MKRTLTALLVAIAAAVLSGCSILGEPAPSPESAPSGGSEATMTATAQPEDSTQAATTTQPAAPSTTQPEITRSTDATEIRYVWPDSTWKVQAGSVDPTECRGEQGSASQFTDRPDYFTCGSTAASLLACHTVSDGDAICIQNPDGLVATKIEGTSVPRYSGAPAEDPIPLRVGLNSGETCSIVAHDHERHWHDQFSWYPCTDGSELLTSDAEGIADTFDSGSETWTVRQSRNQQAPRQNTVAWVEYAGMPKG